MSENTPDNTVGTDTKLSPKTKKTLWKLAFWYVAFWLVGDLVGSIVLTAGDVAVVDALAHAANYGGTGRAIAIISAGFGSFITRFITGLVAMVVLTGGIFVIAVAAVSIISPRQRTNPKQQMDAAANPETTDR